MKIRLIRDDLGVPPGIVCEPGGTVEEGQLSPNIVDGEKGRAWKLGTIFVVTPREAVLLVGNGDAEPADDEAETVCGNWKKNRDLVLESREMLAKGILPEDREAFRRGEILGYDTLGRKIYAPGFIPSETGDDDDDEQDSGAE